jgi:hypothetical protein
LTQSHLALQQDSFAVPDSRLGLDCLLADHQMASLDNVILQHKQAQLRMAKMLRDMELRHLKVFVFSLLLSPILPLLWQFYQSKLFFPGGSRIR